METKDKVKKEEKIEITQKALEETYAGAENRGAISEAEKSLLKRFTDAEINVIINWVWFSNPMQSIRMRLDKLEKAGL